MKKLLFILALGICVSGCAQKTHKDWFAHDGSRADAAIKMAYTYDPNTEIPVVNNNQALELATKKCQVWGYSHAEPFGGVASTCTQMGQTFGGIACIQMTVFSNFQCLGNPGTQPSLK